jgi:hypothetical protein
MQDLWIRRARVPFFSLGTASYMDAQLGDRSYYEKAQRSNRILWGHFDWLYDRVAAALEAHLQAPVRYVPQFALPGFHIFQSDPIFESETASIHCDLQYEKLDWTGFEAPNFANPLSFTLAIELPVNGAGLLVWNLQRADIIRLPRSTLREWFKTSQPNYEPYELGEMVVHSGHTVHQIAPMIAMLADDERITLQGHGIASAGIWHFYW